MNGSGEEKDVGESLETSVTGTGEEGDEWNCFPCSRRAGTFNFQCRRKRHSVRDTDKHRKEIHSWQTENERGQDLATEKDEWGGSLFVCWLVGCLTSQQQTSVSQGWICPDNFTCCHTETEVADPTFYLTQSQYTDTGPTSPGADPISPGAWQGSHWSANFEVTGMTRPRKNPGASGIRTRDLPLSRRTHYH